MRSQIIEAIDESVTSGAKLFQACDAISLCPRRLRRWRKREADGRKGGYRAQTQKLSEPETAAIVEALQDPEMASLPIKTVHARLMDTGVCLASPSTMRRISMSRNLRPKRAASGNCAKRPNLFAHAPNQVWCWDITWLDAKVKGSYFYLYMIIDMYSRKVVGWEVFTKEDGVLARELFSRALASEGILAGQITVHADNGKPMRSKKLRGLFEKLQVKSSYGRPHTSNDNAFAESLFATFKGRVSMPEYFENIQSAREYCESFFDWYNHVHFHSGLDYVTPQNVHKGTHLELYAKRNELLAKNRITHPSRHGGKPKVFAMDTQVRLKHKTSSANQG
jgi:transposase InsO family protein